MLLSFIIVMVFAATMLVASYKDATTMKIPNWVSLVLLGVFFLITPFVWQSWEVFGTHLSPSRRVNIFCGRVCNVRFWLVRRR